VNSAIDPALNLADSLYEIDDFSNSITEYKRFIFFNPESEYLSYAFYKLGLSNMYINNWIECIDATKMSFKYAKDDSLKDEIRITLGIFYIITKNFNLAQLELLHVSQFSKYSKLKSDALFFLGLCYVYMNNWNKAHELFKTFYTKNNLANSEEAKKIDSLLVLAKNSPKKSLRLAKGLSTFLPGSGQIYAGAYFNGLNAFILNCLNTFFFTKSIVNKKYIDASIIFFGILYRYYTGNKYNAGKLAEKYNVNLDIAYEKKILKILLNEEYEYQSIGIFLK
jgi:tetratricopeptide (TPR) repeat protein